MSMVKTGRKLALGSVELSVECHVALHCLITGPTPDDPEYGRIPPPYRTACPGNTLKCK